MMKELEEVLAPADEHVTVEATHLVPVVFKVDEVVEDTSFTDARIRCSSLEEPPTSKKNSTTSSKRHLLLATSYQTSSNENLAKCCTRKTPNSSFDPARRMSKRQRKNSEIYVKQYREWKLSQNYPSISSQRTTVTQLSKDRACSSTRSYMNNCNILSPHTQSASTSMVGNRVFRPNDYLFFSIFTTLFCFFPIGTTFQISLKKICLIWSLIYKGLISLYFSIKSAQSYHLLQLDESLYYSKLALKLNLVAFFTGIVFFIFSLISFFIILYRMLHQVEF